MGGKAKRVIEQPIAYTITDKVFGEFEIKNSANAWWLDKGKVEALFNVCKIDASVEEMCFHAGITVHQYNNFRETHTKFSDIKAILNKYPDIKARQTVVKALDNPQHAFEYLKRKRKLEFSERSELTGAEGQPLIVQISEVIAKKNGIDPSAKSNSK